MKDDISHSINGEELRSLPMAASREARTFQLSRNNSSLCVLRAPSYIYSLIITPKNPLPITSSHKPLRNQRALDSTLTPSSQPNTFQFRQSRLFTLMYHFDAVIHPQSLAASSVILTAAYPRQERLITLLADVPPTYLS